MTRKSFDGLRGLTMSQAHMTLGNIVTLTSRASGLSDEALAAELAQLTLRDMDDSVTFDGVEAIWHAVLRAERVKRRKNTATF